MHTSEADLPRKSISENKREESRRLESTAEEAKVKSPSTRMKQRQGDETTLLQAERGEGEGEEGGGEGEGERGRGGKGGREGGVGERGCSGRKSNGWGGGGDDAINDINFKKIGNLEDGGSGEEDRENEKKQQGGNKDPREPQSDYSIITDSAVALANDAATKEENKNENNKNNDKKVNKKKKNNKGKTINNKTNLNEDEDDDDEDDDDDDDDDGCLDNKADGDNDYGSIGDGNDDNECVGSYSSLVDTVGAGGGDGDEEDACSSYAHIAGGGEKDNKKKAFWFLKYMKGLKKKKKNKTNKGKSDEKQNLSFSLIDNNKSNKNKNEEDNIVPKKTNHLNNTDQNNNNHNRNSNKNSNNNNSSNNNSSNNNSPNTTSKPLVPTSIWTEALKSSFKRRFAAKEASKSDSFSTDKKLSESPDAKVTHNKIRINKADSNKSTDKTTADDRENFENTTALNDKTDCQYDEIISCLRINSINNNINNKNNKNKNNNKNIKKDPNQVTYVNERTRTSINNLSEQIDNEVEYENDNNNKNNEIGNNNVNNDDDIDHYDDISGPEYRSDTTPGQF